MPFCFQQKIRSSIDRYFLQLKEQNPLQSLNWIFNIRSEDSPSDPLITKDIASQSMHLRVERQTLRRLPVSNTILFKTGHQKWFNTK